MIQRALPTTNAKLAEACGPQIPGRQVRVVLGTEPTDSGTRVTEQRYIVDGDKVTYDIAIPEGTSGALVLSPAYRDIVVDGMQLNCSGTDKARSLLAPGRHSVTFRISRPGN